MQLAEITGSLNDLQQLPVHQSTTDLGFFDESGRFKLHQTKETLNNPSAAYLESLSSENSRQTLTSHLNWAATQLLWLQANQAAEHERSITEVLEAVKPTERLRLHEAIDWATLDHAHVQWLVKRRQHVKNGRYYARVSEANVSRQSIDGLLAALKGVCSQAVMFGGMPHDQLLRVSSVRSPRIHREPQRHIPEQDLLQVLLQSVSKDTSSSGVRDLALLSAMYGIGLRRSEVGLLDINVYDQDHKTLRVIGKGNKEVTMPLPQWSFPAIERWLFDLRDPDLPGFLFCPIGKSENLRRERGLTGHGVAFILKKRLAEADLPADINPHALRHAFAHRLDDQGAALADIQESLRHSNPNTTRIYLKSRYKQVKSVIDKDNFSY